MRIPEGASRAAFVLAAAMFAAVVVYSFCNSSGHTSTDPWLALLVFVPAVITGLLHILSCRASGFRASWGIMALVAGLAGILLLLYLDLSGTLLQYENWLERGMQ